MVRLASEVSTSEELHQLVDKIIDDTCKQVMEVQLQPRHINNHNGDNLTLESYDVPPPKGFKKQLGLKTHKRLRSWVEL